ncbi:MAG: hypothetical protein OEZ34_04295 [Spirochaetia bacterium]|nr:hypothetical protein [Spirochaetia bacterium]
MSGPKGLSITAFNAKLSEIFTLQSKIKKNLSSLKELHITDEKRQISFNCDEFIKDQEKASRNLLEKVSYRHTGTVRDQQKIDNKINELKNFLEQTEKEKQLFKSREQDYLSYVSVEEYENQSAASFQNFKKEISAHLDSYLSSGLNLDKKKSDQIAESLRKIQDIKTNFDPMEFAFGFQESEKSIKSSIAEYILEKEKEVNRIRIELSDVLLAAGLPPEKSVSQDETTSMPDEILNSIEKISQLIANVDQRVLQDRYRKDLETLKSSSVFKDVYYYTELYEEIKLKEKTRSHKYIIKELIVDLNKAEVFSDFLTKKQELVDDAVKMLEKETVRVYEYEALQMRFENITEENRKKKEEQELKLRQAEFLKSFLVESLQKKNYRVVDDMEVIDFEKQNDFILKVPNTSNFLNLRFDQDGKFLYNFLISENKNQLSIDQINEKLSSMGNACTDFKAVLEELKEIGVELNIDREIEVSEKALIQAPEEMLKEIQSHEAAKLGLKSQKPRELYMDH